jgi:hypothetical protein
MAERVGRGTLTGKWNPRPGSDLTGPFWTKRIERHCLGKEVGHGEEEI